MEFLLLFIQIVLSAYAFMYQRTTLVVARSLGLPRKIEKAIDSELTGVFIGLVGWVSFVLQVVVFIVFFNIYGFLVALMAFFSSVLIDSFIPIPYDYFKKQIRNRLVKNINGQNMEAYLELIKVLDTKSEK